MYDGVIMVFEPIKLSGQTLEEWVDTRIKNSTADGTTEITVPKSKITVNSYTGFSYSARGLGDAKYWIIQKDAASENALMITAAVHDPEKKNYQAEVDSTLSTVELLK